MRFFFSKYSRNHICATIMAVFFFLSVIYSCNNYKPDIVFEKIKNIKFKISNNTSAQLNRFTYYKSATDAEYLVNLTDKQIEFFDISKSAKTDSVNVSFLPDLNTHGFSVLSMDSFIILKEKLNWIEHPVDNQTFFTENYFYFFSRDSILNKYIINKPVYGGGNYQIYIHSYSPLIKLTKNRFVLRMYANIPFETFFDSHACLILELNDSVWVKSFAKYPEEYTEKQYWAVSGASNTLSKDSSIIVSFRLMHDLYIYNQQGDFIRKINGKSKYFSEFQSSELSKMDQPGYHSRIQIERGEYVTIYYDRYRHLFYRIVRHGNNYNNKDGTTNDFNDGTWSIIIFDEKLNILDELIFSAKKYYSLNILITKEGLMISNNHLLNPSYDEKYLSFSLFSVKKK